MGSAGKSCHNLALPDLRPQMWSKLPNQAEIRAGNGASGRIRFHLMYAAGDLQLNATKTSSNGGLLAKLTPPKGPVPKGPHEIECCGAKTHWINVKHVLFDAQ